MATLKDHNKRKLWEIPETFILSIIINPQLTTFLKHLLMNFLLEYFITNKGTVKFTIRVSFRGAWGAFSPSLEFAFLCFNIVNVLNYIINNSYICTIIDSEILSGEYPFSDFLGARL